MQSLLLGLLVTVLVDLATVGSAAAQSVLYGAANAIDATGLPTGPSSLYRIDLLTGTATLVGPITGFKRIGGMDVDPVTCSTRLDSASVGRSYCSRSIRLPAPGAKSDRA